MYKKLEQLGFLVQIIGGFGVTHPNTVIDVTILSSFWYMHVATITLFLAYACCNKHMLLAHAYVAGITCSSLQSSLHK